MSGAAGDSLFARVGGLTTISRHGPDLVAARARSGLRARFLREADPNGELPDAERERRADLIQRAYYARLAAKSATARRARRGRAWRGSEHATTPESSRRRAGGDAGDDSAHR